MSTSSTLPFGNFGITPFTYPDTVTPIIDTSNPGGLTNASGNANSETPQFPSGGGFGNSENLGIPTVVNPTSPDFGSLITTGLTDALKAFQINQQANVAETAAQNGFNPASLIPNIGNIFGGNAATGTSSSTTGWVLLVVAIVVILFFVLLFRHSGK